MNSIFHNFNNSATSLAWVGVDDCEVTFLNDFCLLEKIILGMTFYCFTRADCSLAHPQIQLCAKKCTYFLHWERWPCLCLWRCDWFEWNRNDANLMEECLFQCTNSICRGSGYYAMPSLFCRVDLTLLPSKHDWFSHFFFVTTQCQNMNKVICMHGFWSERLTND